MPGRVLRQDSNFNSSRFAVGKPGDRRPVSMRVPYRPVADSQWQLGASRGVHGLERRDLARPFRSDDGEELADRAMGRGRLHRRMPNIAVVDTHETTNYIKVLSASDPGFARVWSHYHPIDVLNGFIVYHRGKGGCPCCQVRRRRNRREALRIADTHQASGNQAASG
jgi:hypothetical protein